MASRTDWAERNARRSSQATVSVRAEWAVYKNNCENPVIAELRAALATARREGMEEAAKIADEYAQKTWREWEEAGEDIAAAIRAAAKEGE